MEDNHFLSITGKVNIPPMMKVDNDYTFTGNISVYAVNKSSKQDGSFIITHKAKFVDEIKLIDCGETVFIPDKQSNSQKWRKMTYGRGHEYDDLMKWMFANSDDIFEMYEKQL